MKQWSTLLYGGLLVLLCLVLFFSGSSASASQGARLTPESQERITIQRMNRLLGPAHNGWQVIRNPDEYQRLERKLAYLRYIIYNPWGAINYQFGPYASQANAVASCESGHATWAQNGQYLGMFQMGDYARSVYGHALYALGQARAAYRYFADSGYDWSPWECKP